MHATLKSKTFRSFSANEHSFAWASFNVDSSVFLSSHLHNLSKFDFIQLSVERSYSFSVHFVLGTHFLVKKTDSDRLAITYCVTGNLINAALQPH